MAKKKKLPSATVKLKDYTESRKLFGAYNDPRLTEKKNFASEYVQSHSNIVSRQTIKNIYASQAQAARSAMDADLGMSGEDFLKMMETFGKAQEAFAPKILEYKQAYHTTKGLTGAVDAIRNGRIKEQDITKAIDDFEVVIYRLMNAIVSGSGFEGIDFTKIKSKADITQGDIAKLLEGKENVYTWLKNDAKGAATSLKNLFDNYDAFVEAYRKGSENSEVWTSSSAVVPISEKSAGSIYGSTRKALQSVQGGLGEKVMAAEIAREMTKIEKVLGEMVGVSGSQATNSGRFGKGDISVPFRKSDGHIVNVNLSAKAKKVKTNSETKISFEGGGQDTKSYFDRYGLSSLYEPYTVLSHFRNINGNQKSMNTTLYSISAIVGANHVLEAFGTTQKTHFIAFTNKVVPICDLLEEMSLGSYELHIGANDDRFLKYLGKYNQMIAYEEYKDFKGSNYQSWGSYKNYIEQKSNSIKRTQFVLGYRK